MGIKHQAEQGGRGYFPSEEPSTEQAEGWPQQVKEHAVPPCLVLVIDDNLYGLLVALSYI